MMGGCSKNGFLQVQTAVNKALIIVIFITNTTVSKSKRLHELIMFLCTVGLRACTIASLVYTNVKNQL